MATFKTISSDDIKETTSVLNQLVDFVEEDVSGSNTRKRFQVFVTSSGTNAVTSSLFHTVYDQNFTLQTANELFDTTVGLYHAGTTVTGTRTAIDSNGKFLFPSSSLMMREKVNIYKQFAQLLLGDSSARFTAPFSNATANDNVDEALFVSFKRLFVRDGIKRETFAIKMFQSSSGDITNNLAINSTTNPASGSAIFTDVGSSTSVERSATGGDVGNVVNAANTAETVGLLFYQQGIAVFDMSKVFDGNQIMNGVLQAVGATGVGDLKMGKQNLGAGAGDTGTQKLIPGFITSASIDQILNHVTETRMGSGSNTFLTFQNNTKINSTLYFCRATADEFNFSTNPSYTNTEGRIRVIDTGQEDIEKSFSFVTTVGLYDANEELLAVAKLSRPVEKNDEKDLTFRVRLDF